MQTHRILEVAPPGAVGSKNNLLLIASKKWGSGGLTHGIFFGFLLSVSKGVSIMFFINPREGLVYGF